MKKHIQSHVQHTRPPTHTHMHAYTTPMHTCTHTIHTHIHTCTYIHTTHTRTHHTHIHTHTPHTHMHAHTHAYTTCTHTHMYTSHTQTHTYTHAHTCTHTPAHKTILDSGAVTQADMMGWEDQAVQFWLSCHKPFILHLDSLPGTESCASLNAGSDSTKNSERHPSATEVYLPHGTVRCGTGLQQLLGICAQPSPTATGTCVQSTALQQLPRLPCCTHPVYSP